MCACFCFGKLTSKTRCPTVIHLEFAWPAILVKQIVFLLSNPRPKRNTSNRQGNRTEAAFPLTMTFSNIVPGATVAWSILFQGPKINDFVHQGRFFGQLMLRY